MEQRLQEICERIILREIPHIVNDFNLQGVKGYLDIALGVPLGLKQYLQQYQEILISEFEKKYPDIIVRLYLYDGWNAFWNYSSFKAIYKYILFKLDDSQRDLMISLHDDFGIRSWGEEEDEEVVNVWSIPRHDIGNHGKQVEGNVLDYHDNKNNEMLQFLINEFSMLPLYSDAFSSSDLIEFIEDSTFTTKCYQINSYVPSEALKDALQALIEDYKDSLAGGLDCRFVIYIGPNFEDTETLIHSAKEIIRNKLAENFDNYIDFKVAIAQDENLTGLGDLIIRFFN